MKIESNNDYPNYRPQKPESNDIQAKIKYGKELARWLEKKCNEHQKIFDETMNELNQLCEELSQ